MPPGWASSPTACATVTAITCVTCWRIAENSFSIQDERRRRIVFVANLVHRLFSSFAAIELIREIVDHARFRTDVLVGVNNARRNDKAGRMLAADHLGLSVPVGWRMGSIVPEIDFEIAGAYETEQVSLVDMFVRP